MVEGKTMTVKYIKNYTVQGVYAKATRWPALPIKYEPQPSFLENYQQFANCCGSFQALTKEEFGKDICQGIETFITDEDCSFSFSSNIKYYTIPLEGKDVIHVKLMTDNVYNIDDKVVFRTANSRINDRIPFDLEIVPIEKIKQAEEGPYRDLYFMGYYAVQESWNLLTPDLGWYFSVLTKHQKDSLSHYIEKNLDIVHESVPFTNSNYPGDKGRLIFFIFKRKQNA
jgi:hypothetical protein